MPLPDVVGLGKFKVATLLDSHSSMHRACDPHEPHGREQTQKAPKSVGFGAFCVCSRPTWVLG